jgi:hypothetical protein
MPSVHGVLDRQDIQEQLAGLTCTVDGMLNHICAQVVGAICPHCCGVKGEHEHGADKLDQSKAELTP